MNKSTQDIYISNTDLNEAYTRFFKRFDNILPEYEEIDVLESLDRILCECLYAKISSPYYNSSAMDGIAVRAEDTYNASEIRPKILKENKDFEYINTGACLKPEFNAVIMIEDVIKQDDETIKIISSAHPWQYVRIVGEDIAVGEMILPSRHRIRPVDIGAMLSGGIDKIKVFKKPVIGIIPTGSELIEDFRQIKENKIIESNSRIFENLIIEYGGIPNRYPPCNDDIDSLKKAISQGINENDILLVNAGSSAGRKDYVHNVLRELGEIIVHGIALKPGKPTILASLKDKPIIGIPGYPVSSYIVFETFAKPLIINYSYGNKGNIPVMKEQIKGNISKRIVSSFKNEEIIRVKLGYINDRFIAMPLMRGAGAIMSLVKADGLSVIPKNTEGIEAGEEITVSLLRPIMDIKRTLVSIGSHDMIMDEISDMMDLSSSHTGSMGGIMSLKRNECHIAPIHLLDEKKGQYNLPYIQRFFKGRKMALIKGVKRIQGLMVKKGNPLNINGFESLILNNIKFVNRQKGSGTRILLDYKLKQLGLCQKDIIGYEKEMTNHLAIAAVVQSGSADTGLGVMSAAKGTGLDFIPIGFEEYDFLTDQEYLNDDRIQKFIDIIKSCEFKNRLSKIGGYELENTGDIIIIQG